MHLQADFFTLKELEKIAPKRKGIGTPFILSAHVHQVMHSFIAFVS